MCMLTVTVDQSSENSAINVINKNQCNNAHGFVVYQPCCPHLRHWNSSTAGAILAFVFAAQHLQHRSAFAAVRVSSQPIGTNIHHYALFRHRNIQWRKNALRDEVWCLGLSCFIICYWLLNLKFTLGCKYKGDYKLPSFNHLVNRSWCYNVCVYWMVTTNVRHGKKTEAYTFKISVVSGYLIYMTVKQATG